ncbi:Glucose/ribitol dehydrogenase [Penicillium malachiteum]|uniref:Glucose/ribitol dehydrogenase n=1 Tax=Penicillium malachiteum TaxID=1324776 RepID=UPI002546FAFE|nr:Glucose/ribitol dehydrogenase [Penicillium malachiteum]KAJ5728703.1 Glucose/ribitol dehydrogenase [Penicillium malachiteum]
MAPFPSPTTTWHTESYPSISPNRPELSAKEKSVLVTGGGTGIGAETAISFALAGASRIALLGRREQPLLDTKALIEEKFANVEVFVAPTDVTDKNQVDTAFAKFAESGKLDVLVSGAAMIGPQDPVRDVDGERFLVTVDQNLRGSLFVAQAFLRHASKNAVAIDINSSAAHVNFGPGFSAYNVAKLAVFRLWDSVAAGNPDLSIFHIQPGIVDTDMNKEAGGVKATGIEDHVSLPAHFNVWLASPESRFLKSKFLWANWDVDELEAKAKEIESNDLLSIGLGGWPFQDTNWSATWKS